MAIAIQFKKAVKYDARGRVALVGPAGSGKSYTGLTLARLLAGPTGKIAALDTEHGSLSKYADLFDFDVFDLSRYSPENFIAALDAAEDNKYAVFFCDSLSHFWVGKDGALEFVDLAKRRHKDQMEGWKEFRPHERKMVDRMIASPCHVIVTMRTKTEYVEEVNPANGKKQRRKVGLQPVQREGLEFEFDLVGYMDEDNTLIVDKTRCSVYAKRAILTPSEKDFEDFRDWLKGAKRSEADGAHHVGSGIREVPLSNAKPGAWDRGKVKPAFDAIEYRIGGEAFLAALGLQGYTSIDELPDRDTALRVYKAIVESTKDLPDAPRDQPSSSQAPAQSTAARIEAAAQSNGSNPAMPEQLEALWKRIIDSKSACEVFAALKADLVEIAGQGCAEVIYSEVLGRSGVSHPNQFRNLGKARQTASALWKAIEDAANEPPPPPDMAISEDDPAFIGGEAFEQAQEFANA